MRPGLSTARRVRIIASTVTIFAAVATGLSVPPASAASGDYGHLASAAPQRTCPDTRCAASRTVPAGTWLQVWCWRDAGTSGGTNRWFRVHYSTDGWVSAAAMDRQPAVPYCSDLQPGEALFSGQSVYSGNGAYRLVMQGDGNLVVYQGGTALWSTRTSGRPGAWAVQQGDGNLVVYDGGGAALWHAGTYGNNGARTIMQDDANLVLYRGSTPLYASSWHRTFGVTRGNNNSAGYGWCTWYALERFKGYTSVYPSLWGDASNWDDAGRAQRWQVQGSPTSHAIVVFEGYTNGTSSSAGHVAWSDAVQLRSDGMWVHIAEMNWSGFGKVSERWIKHGSGLSYVTAPSL